MSGSTMEIRLSPRIRTIHSIFLSMLPTAPPRHGDGVRVELVADGESTNREKRVHVCVVCV